MADAAAPKREKNPMAEAANHTSRCLTEEQAPHKWNEAWGQMFSGGIPHEYPERIEYLQQELKNCPPVTGAPKYGTGKAFREPHFGLNNKKGRSGETRFTDEELDEFERSNPK